MHAGWRDKATQPHAFCSIWWAPGINTLLGMGLVGIKHAGQAVLPVAKDYNFGKQALAWRSDCTFVTGTLCASCMHGLVLIRHATYSLHCLKRYAVAEALVGWMGLQGVCVCAAKVFVESHRAFSAEPNGMRVQAESPCPYNGEFSSVMFPSWRTQACSALQVVGDSSTASRARNQAISSATRAPSRGQ